jgi:hypothetical protein
MKEVKFKVRFNLGRGKNYMKWKVQGDGKAEYYSPDEYNVFMYGCTLKNNRNAANKIHQGANKEVCAWILCDEVILAKNYPVPEATVRLTYNPRVQPNWLAGAAVADDQSFNEIWSDGRKLFTNI